MSLKYADAVMALRPVAYWRMGEASGNLADLSGNGNTMVKTGNQSYRQLGAIRGDNSTSIQFGGADYFANAGSASLDVDDVFTIVAWINSQSFSSRKAILNWAGNGPILEVSALSQLQAGEQNTGWYAVSVPTMPTQGWHMVAVAKNGASYALYIDGQPVATTGTNLTCTSTATTEVDIGRNPVGAENWVGYLQDIAVWNSSLTSAQILALYVEGTTGLSNSQVTVVKFREPRPPHGELVTVLPVECKYGFKIRRTGTAGLYVSRSDPNIASNLSALVPNEPAMVTIERPDGFVPWVGYVTQYSANLADSDAFFQCADHSWRLAAPHGARTKKNEFYKESGGGIIKKVFRDMERRAEPQPQLLYDTVTDGPLANYEVRADYGYDVLEEIAQQTNFEWGFSYNVERHRVETYLNYLSRRGTDRRNEEIWQEQSHFTQGTYALTYANGVKASIAIGGEGKFGGRPAVAVSQSGFAADVQAFGKNPVSSYGLGGTRMTVQEQISDKTVLRTRAVQMQEAPEFAVEQLSLQLFENKLDMSRFALGDIRTVRLASANLGVPIERVVRVIGMQFDPRLATIDVEAVVLL